MSTQKLPEVFGDWIRIWGESDCIGGWLGEMFARKDAISISEYKCVFMVAVAGVQSLPVTEEVYESLVRLLSRDSMAYEPPTRVFIDEDAKPYNGKGLVPTGLHKVPPPEVTKAFARANGEG